MYRHPFFTIPPLLCLMVLVLSLAQACVPSLPLSLKNENGGDLTGNTSFSILRPNADPQKGEITGQDIDCDETHGGFPPPLREQNADFFKELLPPSLLVKHEGSNPNLYAILTFSWICQHKKHGRSPTPVQLFPEDRLVSFGGNDDRLNRIGHQITSLPDGRFVVSGGITITTDLPIDELTASSFFPELLSKEKNPAYAKDILLIDPHLSDAGRIRPLGTTQRAYHIAKWTGNALYLQGGLTPQGQNKDEILRIPEAGKETNPSDSRATESSVGLTAFSQMLHLAGRTIDQITGLELSCLANTPTGQLCSFPESCLDPQKVAEAPCKNLEDRLILQTTYIIGENDFLMVGGYLPIKNGDDDKITYRANPYLMYVQIQEDSSRQVYVTDLQDHMIPVVTPGAVARYTALIRPPLLKVSIPNTPLPSFLLLSNLQENHHALLFQFEGKLSFRPKITPMKIVGGSFDLLEFGLHAFQRPSALNEIFLLGSSNSPRKLIFSSERNSLSLQMVEGATNDLFPAAFSAPAWMEQTRLATGLIVFGGGLQIKETDNSPLLIYTPPPLSPPPTQENP